MNTLAMVDEAHSALAQNSVYAVYASALVLTLAMLSFTFDLAQAPGRKSRREGSTSTTTSKKSVESVGGDTAVMTRTSESADSSDELVKRQWAGTGLALTWLGTLVLIAAIAMRGLAVHRPPLGNMYEFCLDGVGFMLVAYLVWNLRHDVRWLGAFVTAPAVLFLMLAALKYYTAASALMPSLKSYWLSIHVTVATLSIGLFTIGFVLTLLYLAQLSREEKGKTGGLLRSLPNSETLDRYAYGVHIIAFPLWMFTVLAGAIWAQQAWGSYWNWDPKEVWSLVIFIVYAAYLHSRVTAGWSGRKAAVVVMIGFACILINYGVVNVYFPGQHSYSGL